MNYQKLIFIISITIVLYTYIGYGIILFLLLKIKNKFRKKIKLNHSFYKPSVSFIVPCYNEGVTLKDKINNTLQLDYPQDKIQYIFITDGTTDGSENYVKNHDHIHLLHNEQRRGKSAAENRAVQYATGDILIFSDANTILEPDTINKIVRYYTEPAVGAVSGEKRILQDKKENAAGAGEGLYWKYESTLKKWDAELNTIVGAAGELFSCRKHLFEPLEEDTILDDFVLSMRIALKGYKVAYACEAAAYETSSSNSKEEMKRKIRISAGGFQAISRINALKYIFNYPLLNFQYFSHRVFRWTLAPLSIAVAFLSNLLLINNHPLYNLIMLCQILFYIAAFTGFLFESKSIRVKALFVPYYFTMMNYAVYAGFIRYIRKAQSSTWERSERKTSQKNMTVSPM